MQSGVVPQDFKQALVNPLIKKQTLCKNDLRNYRPISNLSFLSKILEKVVANRLHEHIYNHHLSNDLQSAYKRFHSTETALLKIHNNIVDNMDNGKVTTLTLLDLSAAFDTIDHSILLQRLHRYFGISGPALRWFKSFLSDRYQSINISGTLSSHLECHKDPSLALFCSTYMLHRSAKLLLIVISVITFMLMTHRFTYHFHNQMYKNIFRL